MRLIIPVLLSALLVLVVFSAVGFAQDETLSESEQELFNETVFVPSPGDLFLALDKLGEVDWNNAVEYNTEFDYDNAYERALNLGVKGAYGFIAIQAEDKEQLIEIIRSIIKISEELGVSETILMKTGTFQQLAESGDWRQLRLELDRLRDDVEYDLIQQGDQDVALLLMAGGWLEGLEATSKVLSSQYTEEGSTILYQPTLVDYFDDEFGNLSSNAQNKEIVQNIKAKIPEIKQLIDVGYQNPVPKENVEKLYQISSELVDAIEKG